eukprot:TRINITY_DN5294_c0_g1_i1.p1 TRINITY_DN5294_c0_g1~~TRINITY_DN5294_c0_g1_i1.p1  ORF type:complete len:965 (+),score=182.56 TRINITY_DN5294_c0_g1_i1:73-2895(+)
MAAAESLKKEDQSFHSVRPFFVSTAKTKTAIESRFQVLRHLKHANLCSYVELIQGSHKRFLAIAEHYQNNLEAELGRTRRDGRGFLENQVWKYAFQIMLAVQYLNENGIVHRNLALNNILIDSQGNVKLSDYGLYFLTNNGKEADFPIGNPRYFPLEVISDLHHTSTKADVWTVGQLMLEMLAGPKLETPSSEPEAIIQQILHACGIHGDSSLRTSGSLSTPQKKQKELMEIANQQFELEKWVREKLDSTDISNELKDIIRLCLTIDPSSRVTAEQLISHPHFDTTREEHVAQTKKRWVVGPAVRSSVILLEEADLNEDTSPIDMDEVEKELEQIAGVSGGKKEETPLSQFFFENVSREDTETILRSNKSDAFLIRTSTSSKGNFVLSVWQAKDKAVSHHLIFSSPAGFYLQHQPRVYRSLADLAKSSQLTANMNPATNPKDSNVADAKQLAQEAWNSLSYREKEASLYRMCSQLRLFPRSPIHKLPNIVRVSDVAESNGAPDAAFVQDHVVFILPNFPPPKAQSLTGPANYEAVKKLPPVVKEKNLNYQRYRGQMFQDLLDKFPSTKELILSEARVDIPPTCRGQIWNIILDIPTDAKGFYESIDKEAEGPADRQLELDIPRCHQYNPMLSSPEGHLKMRRILKAWVKYNQNRLAYWQGLDSVLAPFLILNFSDEAKAFCCLQFFIDKYLQFSFVPDNHAYLQVDMLIFRQLLSYHLPNVAAHLHAIGFRPDLYAIPWFLTLFGHMLPITKTFRVWDAILVEHSSLKYFVAIAIMKFLNQQNKLMQDFNNCILLFSNLPPVNVDYVMEQAVAMFQSTPLGEDFYKYSNERKTQKRLEALQNELAPRISMKDLSETKQRILIVDVRTQEEYSNAHIPNSVHWPLRFKDNEVHAANLDGLEVHRNSHIAIIGARDSNYAILFANKLVESQFPFVSVVDEGL